MIRSIGGSDNVEEERSLESKEIKESNAKVGVGHPHECGRHQERGPPVR